MLPAPFENVFVLTGPTGSGKTALAIDAAQEIHAEIISMDSMALYRGMDVGTAKPSRADRAAVPHHLIDVKEPWESASVAWWLEQARQITQDIESRGKQVLLVGGTPLYLKALVSGLFDGPAADDELRRRLAEEAQTHGTAHLHARLCAVDPVCAARIHPNDLRRVIRALEVLELTGKPMGGWQTQWRTESPGTAAPGNVIWLDMPREALYERINARVEDMFAGGLIDEARALRALGRPLSREASKALGYAEAFAVLDGQLALKEAIVAVQTRSRNFAKRQIAWFKHLPACRPATKELTGTLLRRKINR